MATATQLRIKYGKLGRLRFIGHRDLARALERALRVAQVPLAFTEGFSPHPKVSFGHALSVGAESVAEYFDVTTRETVDLEEVGSLLAVALPEGMPILEIAAITQRVVSLQEVVDAYDWDIHVTGPPEVATRMPTAVGIEVVQHFVEAVRALDVLTSERRRKGEIRTSDVRSAILGMEVLEPTELGARVRVEIAAGAGLRPQEFIEAGVAATGLQLMAERTSRHEQWIQHDGRRLTPLAPEVVGTPIAISERVA